MEMRSSSFNTVGDTSKHTISCFVFFTFRFFFFCSNTVQKQRRESSHQVIVRFDAEQISEVAEGQGSVGLEAEIGVVVRRGQVASLAATCKSHMSECIRSERKDVARFKHKEIHSGSHNRAQSSGETMPLHRGRRGDMSTVSWYLH